MLARGSGQSKAMGGSGRANAVELSPQPYPPKGTLLTPGAQQTMLGTQANSPSASRGKSTLWGMQRSPVIAPAMIQKTSPGMIGPSQTMSANGGTSPAQQSPLSRGVQPTTVAPGMLAERPRSPNISNMRPASIGTITGAVWWDTTQVKFTNSLLNVSQVCSAGMRVLAEVAQKSQTGPFASMIPVGSYQLIQSTQSGSIDICAYRITGLPVGMPMTLQVNPNGADFTVNGNIPHGVASFGQVTIPGGSCGTAPPEQLNAPLSYCGEGAYNANFSLAPTIVN